MNQIIYRIFAITIGLLGLMAAHAQPAWPTKPVRVIVAGGAGSGTDLTARIFADAFSKSFGQPFVIDNKVGANGLIATDALMKSPGDGYSILVTYAAAHVINPLIMEKAPFNPTKDFAPVVQIGSGGNLLMVHPSVPVKNLQELLAYIRSQPANSLSYGSWGDGSGGHLTMEALLQKAGNLKMQHVPYKTTSTLVTDLVGGHVKIAFTAIANGIPMAQSGKLRALAVSGPNRVPQLPEVRTMTEQGIPFEMASWYAIVAPLGTPPAVVDRLNKEANRLMAAPDMAEQMLKIGFSAFPANTPQQFQQSIERDSGEWSTIARAAGIKLPSN
jgi:tripartite-type tricarboxylate transporter receptor subunit TctC